MFISGVGGKEKSFLIEIIKCFVDSLWKAKLGELSCAIVAPTGLAAFNVGGLTIHRLFQLLIEHENKTAKYWSLPKDTQKKLQTTFIDGIQSQFDLFAFEIGRHIWFKRLVWFKKHYICG